MNAVDTNVLVYSLDPTEPVKQAKAVSLLQQLGTEVDPPVLFWQVLCEFLRQLRTWESNGRLTWQDVLDHGQAVRGLFSIVQPIPIVLDAALELSSRYSLSHWDSMILGACKSAGVATLYTEDMGAADDL